MLVLGASLLTIAALVQLVDFHVGRKGDEAVRRWLLNVYAALDREWTAIYQVPALATANFIRLLFSDGLKTFIPRVAIASVSTYFAVLIVFSMVLPSEGSEFSDGEIFAETVLYLDEAFHSIVVASPYFWITLVPDLISRSSGMTLLRMVATSGPLKALAAAILATVLMFICVALGAVELFAGSYFVQNGDVDPDTSISYIPILIVGFPLTIYAILILICLLINLLQAPTRRVLLWMLPRLERVNRTVLSALAVGIGLPGGVLVAWSKLIG